MLKIKDNINLKELEKFGFIDDGFFYTHKYDDILVLGIEIKTREIFVNRFDIDLLFDLIISGLVEKV